MAYYAPVIFIETPIFTRDVKALLADEEYGELQQLLANHPDRGDVIAGTGELRKVRWSLPGRGETRWVSRIYFWRVNGIPDFDAGYLHKGEKVDLTPADKKLLRKIVETWK